MPESETENHYIITNREGMTEKFWLQDPMVLIHPKYLHRFFPSENFYLTARMNSIVRACIYIAITLSLIQQNIAWLLLPLFALGFTASWMYKENPQMILDKKTKQDPNLKYLVSVILDGHPIKKRKNKKESGKKSKADPPQDLFRNTDDIMQDLQKERAIQTDAVGGMIPDTPRFARNLLGMDR